MTTDTVPMQDPIDPNGVADEAAKPKRTRRPKALVEATPASVDDGVVQPDQAPTADAAPKAPRKRKVAEAAPMPIALGVDAAEALPAEAAKPKRSPRKKADA